jgi:hypothetical protein
MNYVKFNSSNFDSSLAYEHNIHTGSLPKYNFVPNVINIKIIEISRKTEAKTEV